MNLLTLEVGPHSLRPSFLKEGGLENFGFETKGGLEKNIKRGAYTKGGTSFKRGACKVKVNFS